MSRTASNRLTIWKTETTGLGRAAIRSKSSFIREAVAKAAEEEVKQIWKLPEALRQMDSKKGAGKA